MEALKLMNWGSSSIGRIPVSMQKSWTTPCPVQNWMWWCTPGIPALRRARQDHKFKIMLSYIANLRPAWAT